VRCSWLQYRPHLGRGRIIGLSSSASVVAQPRPIHSDDLHSVSRSRAVGTCPGSRGCHRQQHGTTADVEFIIKSSRRKLRHNSPPPSRCLSPGAFQLLHKGGQRSAHDSNSLRCPASSSRNYVVGDAASRHSLLLRIFNMPTGLAAHDGGIDLGKKSAISASPSCPRPENPWLIPPCNVAVRLIPNPRMDFSRIATVKGRLLIVNTKRTGGAAIPVVSGLPAVGGVRFLFCAAPIARINHITKTAWVRHVFSLWHSGIQNWSRRRNLRPRAPL